MSDRERERERELTGEWNGAIDGEDAGVAAEVAELAVGVAREDFAAVATEEFESGFRRFGSELGWSEHGWFGFGFRLG